MEKRSSKRSAFWREFVPTVRIILKTRKKNIIYILFYYFYFNYFIFFTFIFIFFISFEILEHKDEGSRCLIIEFAVLNKLYVDFLRRAQFFKVMSFVNRYYYIPLYNF